MSSKKVVRNSAVDASAKRQSKKVEATETTVAATAPAPVVAPVATAPVATAPVATAPVAPKGRGRKAVAPKEEETPVKKTKRAPKVTEEPVVAATPAAVTATTEGGEEEDDGRRSFKAKFPGQELFDGRFIGSTPYQAGSKALSIFYRNFRKANPEGVAPNMIKFSICETTRGSNKTESSYVGSRKQLDSPVSYTITGKDGARQIVKNFKNHLQRIKVGANGLEMVGGKPLSEYMASPSTASTASPASPASPSTASPSTDAPVVASVVAAETPATKVTRKQSKKVVTNSA